MHHTDHTMLIHKLRSENGELSKRVVFSGQSCYKMHLCIKSIRPVSLLVACSCTLGWQHHPLPWKQGRDPAGTSPGLGDKPGLKGTALAPLCLRAAFAHRKVTDSYRAAAGLNKPIDLHRLISEAAPLSAMVPLFRQVMRRIPLVLPEWPLLVIVKSPCKGPS